MKKTNMTHKDRVNCGNVSIYLTDKPLFNKLTTEIGILWYQHFHENLSMANILIKSMLFLRQYLQGEMESSDNKPVIKKYARLGS